ncbi:MAG: transglutaminase-like domain-containing protein [Acidimicrobiales bacterium]
MTSGADSETQSEQLSHQSEGPEFDQAWLDPTWFIDSDHPDVVAFAQDAVGDKTDETDRAVALFLKVRDGFRYDPYAFHNQPENYKASSVAASTANWCTPKSVLLAAAARSQGIPARLGFADVRNHLTSEKLTERMGTDLFAWHGYVEMLLGGRWFKVSSAFNIELCQRFGVKVLDFDGTADALFHPFDEAGNRHMEYVRQRGSFNDLPLDQINADFAELYGEWGGEPDGTSASTDNAFN